MTYSTGQEGPSYPAPTPTEKGVWNIQEVRDKQLEGTGLWKFDAPSAPSGLFVVGNNREGILGTNHGPQFAHRSSPIQVGTDTNWSKLFENMGATVMANAAGRAEGTLYMWGTNSYGTLGLNESGASRSSPCQVPGTTWSSLTGTFDENIYTYAAYRHMGAIQTDGSLYTWGYNANGQLGVNKATNYSSPIQVPGTWSNITNSSENMTGVKTNGTLWMWGQNNYGMLGQNNASQGNSSSPIQIGSDTTWIAGYAVGSASMFGVKRLFT